MTFSVINLALATDALGVKCMPSDTRALEKRFDAQSSTTIRWLLLAFEASTRFSRAESDAKTRVRRLTHSTVRPLAAATNASIWRLNRSEDTANFASLVPSAATTTGPTSPRRMLVSP